MKPLHAAALFLFSLNLSASAEPDLPPVPRLGSAPDSSAWTIAYQYKTPNPFLKPPPDPSMADDYARMRNQYPRMISIAVSKVGEQKKEVRQFDNDRQIIRWISGNLLVMENPQLKTFSTWDAKVPGTELFTHDFDSLDWIDKAEYKGHQVFQQVNCCVYYSKETPAGEQTAYIDAKSGLPVGVVQGDITLLYAFQPFSGTIEFPPQVTAAIKKYQDMDSAKPGQ